MTAGAADGAKDEVMQLVRELHELILVQPTQICRIVDLFEQALHQCVRLAIQSAISTRRRAVPPKPASEARASACSASMRSRAAARPISVTYVDLRCTASLPAVLPRLRAVPSTSRT